MSHPAACRLPGSSSFGSAFAPYRSTEPIDEELRRAREAQQQLMQQELSRQQQMWEEEQNSAAVPRAQLEHSVSGSRERRDDHQQHRHHHQQQQQEAAEEIDAADAEVQAINLHSAAPPRRSPLPSPAAVQRILPAAAAGGLSSHVTQAPLVLGAAAAPPSPSPAQPASAAASSPSAAASEGPPASVAFSSPQSVQYSSPAAVRLLPSFGYYERYSETESLSEESAAELLDRCGRLHGLERVEAFQLLMEVAGLEVKMREPKLRLQREMAASRDMEDDIAFRQPAAAAAAARD